MNEFVYGIFSSRLSWVMGLDDSSCRDSFVDSLFLVSSPVKNQLTPNPRIKAMTTERINVPLPEEGGVYDWLSIESFVPLEIITYPTGISNGIYFCDL